MCVYIYIYICIPTYIIHINFCLVTPPSASPPPRRP